MNDERASRSADCSALRTTGCYSLKSFVSQSSKISSSSVQVIHVDRSHGMTLSRTNSNIDFMEISSSLLSKYSVTHGKQMPYGFWLNVLTEYQRKTGRSMQRQHLNAPSMSEILCRTVRLE